MTFDPKRAQTTGHAGAQVLGPGHPLLDTVAELTELRARDQLRAGAVLVDPGDAGVRPRMFAAVIHEIVDGTATASPLSKDVAFVEIDESTGSRRVGPAFLDYRPATDDELSHTRGALDGYLDGADPADLAVDWTMRQLVPPHLERVRATHGAAVARARADITERLESEVRFWSGPRSRRQAHPGPGGAAGRRLASAPAPSTHRARRRGAHRARPPRVLATALVVPAGLLGSRSRVGHRSPHELEAGSAPRSVSAGPASSSGRRTGPRCGASPGGAEHLARRPPVHPGGARLVMSRTEVLQARNLAERHRLVLVAEGPRDEPEVRYVRDPFARLRTDDFHQHQFTLPLGSLWRAGVAPF